MLVFALRLMALAYANGAESFFISSEYDHEYASEKRNNTNPVINNDWVPVGGRFLKVGSAEMLSANSESCV